jgi:hypothetical protein
VNPKNVASSIFSRKTLPPGLLTTLGLAAQHFKPSDAAHFTKRKADLVYPLSLLRSHFQSDTIFPLSLDSIEQDIRILPSQENSSF